MSSAVPAVVLTLLDAARRGNLVLCIGAGVSMADDACLPSGVRLGEMLDERLHGRLDGYVRPDDVQNLIAVADAAVVPAGGLEALQVEVLQLARFTTAVPNFGHRAIALLLVEGALTALSWNWDTCIERAAGGELQQVARTQADMEELGDTRLAKVHGCATMRRTLLITSEQLANPPLWADHAFQERIRGSAVVFIGIGDVADYAQRRLRQLLEDLAPLDVRVVSPSIGEGWDTSMWSELLPQLEQERRVAQTADEFLDALARAWARELLERVGQDARNLSAEFQDGVRRVVDALGQLGSVDAIRWCRNATIQPESGESAVRAENTGGVVLAAGVLAAEAAADVTTPRPACCAIGDDVYELLIPRERMFAPDVRREARRRAQQLASDGLGSEGETTFLVGGTVIGQLDGPADTPPDVLAGTPDATNLIDGPSAVQLGFVRASTLLENAA